MINKRFSGEGEEEALEVAVAIARQWGYGNLITCLKKEWVLVLIHKYNIPPESALKATMVAPSIEEILSDVETGVSNDS